MNPQDSRVCEKRVADPVCHHDDGPRLLRLAYQTINIKSDNRERGVGVFQRLDDRPQYRILSRLAYGVRFAISLLVETLERRADDFAP